MLLKSIIIFFIQFLFITETHSSPEEFSLNRLDTIDKYIVKRIKNKKLTSSDLDTNAILALIEQREKICRDNSQKCLNFTNFQPILCNPQNPNVQNELEIIWDHLSSLACESKETKILLDFIKNCKSDGINFDIIGAASLFKFLLKQKDTKSQDDLYDLFANLKSDDRQLSFNSYVRYANFFSIIRNKMPIQLNLAKSVHQTLFKMNISEKERELIFSKGKPSNLATLAYFANKNGHNKQVIDFFHKNALTKNINDEQVILGETEALCTYSRLNNLNQTCIDKLNSLKRDVQLANSDSFLFDIDFKIAYNLDFMGKHSESLKISQQLLIKAEKEKNRDKLSLIRNHMAAVHFHMKNFEEAKKQFELADELFEKLERLPHQKAYKDFLLLNFYMFSGDYKSAMSAADKVLDAYKNFFNGNVETTYIAIYYKVFLLLHFDKKTEANNLLRDTLLLVDEKSDYKFFKILLNLLDNSNIDERPKLLEDLKKSIEPDGPLYQMVAKLSKNIN
jgi:tetratricopeptide (TPR) repeat protein